MKPRTIALLIAILSCAGATAQQSRWWSIEEVTYRVEGQPRGQAYVLTVDMARARLRVASVAFEVGREQGNAELSIQSLGEELSHRRSRGEMIIVNGGFSSYRPDTPLGLLIVEGKTYSTLSKERPRIAWTDSAFATIRWSGILCQPRGTERWEVQPADLYKTGLCNYALQSGPVLVEPIGRPLVSKDESAKTRATARTVLCLNGGHASRVVVTKNEAALGDLAIWMSTPRERGGLACEAALNLSGDSASGLTIVAPGRAPVVVGDATFPVASVLIFEPRAPISSR